MVQRRDPPQLPGWFMQSIDFTIKLMREIAGGVDLFQDGKGMGQMRGPMAVPMLQEILDSQWGNLYQHYGERIRQGQGDAHESGEGILPRLPHPALHRPEHEG